MFLILNSVPVTFVTDPELVRPSVPVMMHSLEPDSCGKKGEGKKVRS
jgi:hypothetical protein